RNPAAGAGRSQRRAAALRLYRFPRHRGTRGIAKRADRRRPAGVCADGRAAGDRAAARHRTMVWHGAVSRSCARGSLARGGDRLPYRLAREFLHRHAERTGLFPKLRQICAVAGSETMTEEVRGAVCVGEVLIELARGADGRFSLSCGGDTFNTTIYLARAGVEKAFASALGHHAHSHPLLSFPPPPRLS